MQLPAFLGKDYLTFHFVRTDDLKSFDLMDGKVQSITTIFIICYEVESIAKIISTSHCVDLPLLQEVFTT
jgi:hypothetical protein